MTRIGGLNDVRTDPRGEADSTELRSGRSGTLLGVVAASGIALVLGAFRLGAPSIWLDEAFTARAITYPYPDLLLQFHWVFYSIEKVWTSFAGTSEWSLRVPALIGAMLACALLVVLAGRLFDRWVAVIAGVLLACNPFFVQWSQQARGYTFIAAVNVAAFVLAIRALERGSRGAWLAYGTVFSVVLLAHPVSGVSLIPAHAVFIYQRRERVTRHAFLAGIVILGLGLAWAGVVASYTSGASSPIDFPTLGRVARAFAKNSGAMGIGLLLSLAGLWFLVRTRRRDVAVWLTAWAFAPFVITVIGSAARPMFLDRYLLVTAPAYALLAAVAIRSVGPRARSAIAVAVVVATSIGLTHWYSIGDGGNNWHGENWRAAVAMVYGQRGYRDEILVIPFFAYPGAAYYGAPWTWVAPERDSIWALRWSETGTSLSATDRRMLGLDGYRLVESQRFGWRVTAQHWIRSP